MPKKSTSPSQSSTPGSLPRDKGRVVVQNVNVPGYTTSVDASKYTAMRHALLKVLPARPPGLTQAEIRTKVLPFLPGAVFPGGAKAAWWAKSVQLDLEAKRLIVRESSKPLRWHRKTSR